MMRLRFSRTMRPRPRPGNARRWNQTGSRCDGRREQLLWWRGLRLEGLDQERRHRAGEVHRQGCMARRWTASAGRPAVRVPQFVADRSETVHDGLAAAQDAFEDLLVVL